MLRAKIMVRSVLQTTIKRREEAGNYVYFSMILAKDGKGDLAVVLMHWFIRTHSAARCALTLHGKIPVLDDFLSTIRTSEHI
jgi:hypothetical protein